MSSSSCSENSKTEKCGCGVPFARRVSWTKENPGRRFKTCVFYDPDTNWRGCKKFKWVDQPEMTVWQREVTNKLVEEKRQLATEIKILTSRVSCLEHEKEQAFSEIKMIKKKWMNEREHYSQIKSFVLGFLFCFLLVFVVLIKGSNWSLGPS